MKRINSEAVSPFLWLLGLRGLLPGRDESSWEAEGWLCDLQGSFWARHGQAWSAKAAW